MRGQALDRRNARAQTKGMPSALSAQRFFGRLHCFKSLLEPGLIIHHTITTNPCVSIAKFRNAITHSHAGSLSRMQGHVGAPTH